MSVDWRETTPAKASAGVCPVLRFRHSGNPPMWSANDSFAGQTSCVVGGACSGSSSAPIDTPTCPWDSKLRGVPQAPQTFDRLVGGDTLTLGSRRWRVIPGYGHSTEHAALADVEARVLIAGDMLLPRISTNVAVWASEPDADPVQRFLDSLAAFETLAPDTLVLPSHGLPFRGIGARVGQLRAHHAARLAELHRFLAEAGVPKSAHDAIPVLFRRELDMHQRFFAIGEAIAHLNHLWRTGRATREMRDDGAIRFTAQ